ncbi:vWA domain-containing protein [Nocardioides yefusunii]|uniref:VWA domain-containing protein n=1 Tax=Nocardioides yefusunii TaxID=2500546 RepID=A0ABW1QUT2_9ACTN|nr:VWA domain-containing protein [Nocardioides yefusunii]
MILNPEWVVLAFAAPTALWCTVALARSLAGVERGAALSRLLVALAVVGIGLRPTATEQVEVPVPSTTDLVVLLDRTASMAALDAAGGRSRIEAAGDDLAALVTATRGAEVTVVVFDDDARVAVPTTTDATAVGSFLRSVGWRPSVKATGSDVSVAVDLTSQLLTAMQAADPDHERYLVYAGDGEQTQSAAPSSFAELADLVDGALVLGYGTEQGAPMPVAPGETEQVSVDGEVQLSKIDEKNLNTIAADLGAPYLHRTDGGELPEFASAEHRTRSELEAGAEYHWWIALGAFPFLVHLMVLAVRDLREVRREA